MTSIERQLQLCLNKIQDWADNNGFKFSKTKTTGVHFCQKRKVHNDPDLKLDGIPIKIVKEFKFLGVIFDSKLSFIPHIKMLRTKCTKALDILKVVANTQWGADKNVLLQLYRSIVRSKLDYGCFVYGSARKSYLQALDAIHNQGLRICLGAFPTSPVKSLYVEANEPPLKNRRIKLALQYIIKLRSNLSHPTYNCVFQPNFEAKHIANLRTIKPLGIRMKKHIENSNIDFKDISEFQIPDIPLWEISKPTVNLDLTNCKKSVTNPLEFNEKFVQIKHAFNTFEEIYTDGSKDQKQVASAAIHRNNTISARLPDNSSIFTAEAKALQFALDFIKQSKSKKYIIYSDSLSCLQTVKNGKINHPYIYTLLKEYTSLKRQGYNIVFCWIPSHIGIRGNTKADSAAKRALQLPVTNFKIPHTDFKPMIREYVKHLWQTDWNECINNKLHDINPTVGKTQSIILKRQDEVVITKLRIGHSRLTHSCLLKREDRPECVFCQCPLTVNHILLECGDTTLIRNTYFNVQSMTELFNNVDLNKILGFLHETGFYQKIEVNLKVYLNKIYSCIENRNLQ